MTTDEGDRRRFRRGPPRRRDQCDPRSGERREFIDRAAGETGVGVEVISGVEEARLIHLGVLQAVPVFDRRLLSSTSAADPPAADR